MLATTASADCVLQAVKQSTILLTAFCYIYSISFERMTPRHWHQWPWDRLVHVCQRRRSIIFASSNTLNLKLIFEPVICLELLGIWPPLPIIVRNFYHSRKSDYNFGSVLMHRNRICAIHLCYSKRSRLEQLVSAMQGQSPALTYLVLYSLPIRRPPALPVGFLGGHAPRPQTLELHCIPFPTLPKLLLFATDLVRFTLRSMSHSGYISRAETLGSPETMVTCLFAY
jgi:hypothetical protein